jgi:hypothetical protein
MRVDLDSVVTFKNRLVDEQTGKQTDIQVLTGRVYQIDSFGIYVVDQNEDCYVIQKEDILKIIQ